LQDLIKSKNFMDKMESLLQVERELTRVRGEIEGYQGQMRVWGNQISLSTIRLTLQEPIRAVPSGSLSVEVASLAEANRDLLTVGQRAAHETMLAFAGSIETYGRSGHAVAVGPRARLIDEAM